jgi:hypothetical protein
MLSISFWWVSRCFGYPVLSKAHQAFADNPSTVFAAMNMVLLFWEFIEFRFKEKMSQRNYIGLAFALVSIVLIALSQIYV